MALTLRASSALHLLSMTRADANQPDDLTFSHHRAGDTEKERTSTVLLTGDHHHILVHQKPEEQMKD